MKKVIIGLLLASIIFSGCAATNQKMTAADRQNIKALRINDNIEKGPEMFYSGGAGAGAFFGAIGGAISAASNVKDGVAISQTAEKNKLSIEKIVLDEVNTAFQQAGKIPVAAASDDKGATSLIIVIDNYGFRSANGLTDNLVPVISLKLSIQDSSGKLIWNFSNSFSPDSSIKPVPLNDIKDNPKIIEDLWRTASRKVVINALEML